MSIGVSGGRVLVSVGVGGCGIVFLGGGGGVFGLGCGFG